MKYSINEHIQNVIRFFSQFLNKLPTRNVLAEMHLRLFPAILLASKRKKRFPTTQTNYVYLAVSKQKGTRRGRFTPSADGIGRRK